MESFKDIWFVDDNEVFRFILNSFMEDSGYGNRIDFFDDGDRAILKLVELSTSGHRPPKIIFLDLNMKRLEGWQLIDLLNELDFDVKVVILTSEIGIKNKERSEQEPLVKGYLTKPVDQSKIEALIKELDQ